MTDLSVMAFEQDMLIMFYGSEKNEILIYLLLTNLKNKQSYI